MGKQTCWEFKKCSREPGGSKVSEYGICPAATHVLLDGLNNGKNAGRICWAVAGTLCGGKPVGTFVQKTLTCMNCDFYKMVKEEEGSSFRFTKD